MRMKKILTEWRNFLKEGVSQRESLAKIEEINNNSKLSNEEGKKQIASIYLTFALRGGEIKNRPDVEFYKRPENKKFSLQVLDVLIKTLKRAEDSDTGSFKDKFFTSKDRWRIITHSME